ncbi:MAG: glycosyltransferase family 2 protein [Planctomycetota bacterium]
MTVQPGYAVGVVHHGDPAPTLKCLASLRSVAPPFVVGFVLWNDPAETLREVRDHPALRGFDVLCPDANTGFAAGANRLAQEAAARGCDFLWLLNNDVRVSPTTAGQLVEALSADANVALVGPRILHPDGTVWHDGGRLHWPGGRVESPGHGAPPDAAGVPFDVDFVCGCAPMIRLDAWQSVGGFDERYFLYYEDVDVSLRLQAAGWRVLHAPAAVVEHAGSKAVAAHGPALARYYRVRNRRLLLGTHRPGAVISSVGDLWRSLRYAVSGRAKQGRAIRCALRDAKTGTWGRRKDVE